MRPLFLVPPAGLEPAFQGWKPRRPSPIRRWRYIILSFNKTTQLLLCWSRRGDSTPPDQLVKSQLLWNRWATPRTHCFPTVCGGCRGIRTPDQIVKSYLLYQLSYAPSRHFQTFYLGRLSGRLWVTYYVLLTQVRLSCHCVVEDMSRTMCSS